ncbi:MAG: hypothetical protein SP4CHLAM5_08680 [Chlamydiia bacterium]|nr:hypothetical protein [Chlamydiia bacterium]MCH9618731.1 hypothetical protein [Chlamydiia bacterium]MCH9624529.1 hypothetical protein [Chlamydiia bacterium]
MEIQTPAIITEKNTRLLREKNENIKAPKKNLRASFTYFSLLCNIGDSDIRTWYGRYHIKFFFYLSEP